MTRRLAAEALGTGLLVAVIVGSGIAAAELSPGDVGLQLLENALATAAGLAVIILLVEPVSGAHLNPVVSIADWWIGRHRGSGLRLTHLGAYAAAQIVGAIFGACLANLMYGLPAISIATTTRSGSNLFLSEVVATAGLVALIFALARRGRAGLTAAAVGAYIGAAYWFTASTSFANPAVTIGRMFSDISVSAGAGAYGQLGCIREPISAYRLKSPSRDVQKVCPTSIAGSCRYPIWRLP